MHVLSSTLDAIQIIHLALFDFTSILDVFDLIPHNIIFNKIIYNENYEKSQNKVYSKLLPDTAHKPKPIQIKKNEITFLTFKLPKKFIDFVSIIVCKYKSKTNNNNIKLHYIHLKKNSPGMEILPKYCFICDIFSCFKIIKFQFFTKKYG